MQFIQVISVLAVIGHAAAAPSPKCTTTKSYSATPTTPKPSNLLCGTAGMAHFVAGVIIADVTHPGQTANDCALSCLEDSECQGLAFDSARSRCLTFRDTPAEMGFVPEPSAVFSFWHHGCWSESCSTTTSCVYPTAAPSSS